jgi:hypothetical protein
VPIDDHQTKKKTPYAAAAKMMKKSSLESDCRSPLLIENDESVFDKLLSSELASMASKKKKNKAVKAETRKPFGLQDNNAFMMQEEQDINVNSNNDSLVI